MKRAVVHIVGAGVADLATARALAASKRCDVVVLVRYGQSVEDEIGRIAPAFADMALARSDGTPRRFYSMSSQIRVERKSYYDTLERTQKGGLDVTLWIAGFLDCLDRAFKGAETILASVLRKARFWDVHAGDALNDRERLVVNRLLNGFEGKLTSSKYADFAKCSQDTAAREIDNLSRKSILVRDPAGGHRHVWTSPAKSTNRDARPRSASGAR